jgi:hypothetical protein
MISESEAGRSAPGRLSHPLCAGKVRYLMNNSCFCNIFDDKYIWLIIIVLLILFGCGNNGCGCN